jgi:hypothetical protein
MWIAVDKPSAQPNGFQQLLNTRVGLPSLCYSKRVKRLPNNLPHSHPRIERSIWVLKDDLKMPALFAQFAGRKLRQITTPVKYLTGSGLSQTDDRAS